MKVLRRILVGLVLLAFLGGGIFLMLRQSHPQELVLKSGAMVRLLGAIPGGQTFSTEKPWEAFLRRKLPAKYLRWLAPVRSMNCGYNGALSVAVLRQVDDSKDRAFWSRIEAIDETGFVYSNHTGNCSTGPVDGSYLVSFSLRRFPRRQAEFPIRFYDSEDQFLGEFRISNPVNGPFPDWTAEALPQTKEVDGLRVVLNGFGERTYGDRTFFQPDITITDTDGQPTDFRRRYHDFSDATGNSGGMLSPREKVWQSTVKLYRPKDGPYDPAATTRFTVDTVPAKGEVVPLQQVASVGEDSIQLYFVAGPGITTLSNGIEFSSEVPERELNRGTSSNSSGNFGFKETWECNQHLVVLDLSDPGDDVEFLVFFRDQDGREIEPADAFHGYSGGGGIAAPFARRYKYSLPLEDVEQLTIECVVNRGVSFDFLVDSGPFFETEETTDTPAE